MFSPGCISREGVDSVTTLDSIISVSIESMGSADCVTVADWEAAAACAACDANREEERRLVPVRRDTP